MLQEEIKEDLQPFGTEKSLELEPTSGVCLEPKFQFQPKIVKNLGILNLRGTLLN